MRETLADEYRRDVKAAKNPHIPVNYFPNNDPTRILSVSGDLTLRYYLQIGLTTTYTSLLHTIYTNKDKISVFINFFILL